MEHVQSDTEKFDKVTVTIGPKGSYFARSGSSHISHALPRDLQTAIKESESPPYTVALGIKGAWIAIFEDRTCSWNLRNAYPSLSVTGKLESTANRAVFAALNPFMEDRYFLVIEDGECSYNITFSSKEEGEALHAMTDTYMRFRAKRDGSTFSHPLFSNGVPREIRITPNSSPQETRRDALMATLRARSTFMKPRDMTSFAAVAGGTGLLAKVAGLSAVRAVGVGTAVGLGFALSIWER